MPFRAGSRGAQELKSEQRTRFETLKRAYPQYSGYQWPCLSTPEEMAKAEKRSLKYQVGRFVRLDREIRLDAPQAVRRVVELYSAAGARSSAPLGGVAEVIHSFRDLVNKEAHPGYPLCLISSSNKKLVEDDDYWSQIVGASVTRVEKLLDEKCLSWENTTAQQLLDLGLVDPVRVMIKNEPHPVAKIEAGRYRLICVVSLIDQLVCRYFNQAQNDAEILAARRGRYIPNKIGLAASVPKFCHLIANHVHKFQRIVDNDMSGWDWSVNTRDLWNECYIKQCLCDHADARFLNGMINQCLVQGLSTFVLSNGEVWQQAFPALQKSGSFTTGSGNGRIRTLLAMQVGSRDCVVMGDDCVEDTDLSQSELTASYLKLGKRLTDVHIREGDSPSFSFCSHTIQFQDDQWVGVPEQVPRCVIRAVYSKESTELVLADLERDLQYSPNLRQVLAQVLWVREGQNGEAQ